MRRENLRRLTPYLPSPPTFLPPPWRSRRAIVAGAPVRAQGVSAGAGWVWLGRRVRAVILPPPPIGAKPRSILLAIGAAPSPPRGQAALMRRVFVTPHIPRPDEGFASSSFTRHRRGAEFTERQTVWQGKRKKSEFTERRKT